MFWGNWVPWYKHQYRQWFLVAYHKMKKVNWEVPIGRLRIQRGCSYGAGWNCSAASISGPGELPHAAGMAKKEKTCRKGLKTLSWRGNRDESRTFVRGGIVTQLRLSAFQYRPLKKNQRECFKQIQLFGCRKKICLWTLTGASRNSLASKACRSVFFLF